MQEIWVQSLGQENPLKEGMEICSSILARKTSWTVEPNGLHSIAHKESDTTEATKHSTVQIFKHEKSVFYEQEVAYGTMLTSAHQDSLILNHSTLSKSVCAQHTPTCLRIPLCLCSAPTCLGYPFLPCLFTQCLQRKYYFLCKVFWKALQSSSEPLLLCATVPLCTPLEGHHLFLNAFKEHPWSSSCAPGTLWELWIHS